MPQDFAGAVYDADGDNPADRTQARGERDPFQGLTSPNFRKWRKRWTVAYRDTGSSELRALTIALDTSGLHASAVAADGPVTAVELADSDRHSRRGAGRHPRSPHADRRRSLRNLKGLTL